MNSLVLCFGCLDGLLLLYCFDFDIVIAVVVILVSCLLPCMYCLILLVVADNFGLVVLDIPGWVALFVVVVVVVVFVVVGGGGDDTHERHFQEM